MCLFCFIVLLFKRNIYIVFYLLIMLFSVLNVLIIIIIISLSTTKKTNLKMPPVIFHLF